MTQNIFCGIDFGTSNSSIAVASRTQKPQLIAVEGEHITIPSAIFYQKNSSEPSFGRLAMQKYMDGEEGRLMRSLKRVLGTDLMETGTILNGKSVKFENILAQFINYLKNKAEKQIGAEIKKVVMGRPVHFRDNDSKGDAKAQNQLQEVAQKAGFEEISFQFEPIAAAYAHEEHIEGEKLACVIDIGGGTSDFSIIRLGEKVKNKTNRQEDILANTGVRIGGNDFDKDLSMQTFMPKLGYKTTYGTKNLFVPSSQYFDMAEWSKINFAYNYQNLKIIKNTLVEAHEPQKYARLLEVYENKLGHRLLAEAENSKINLTKQQTDEKVLSFISDKPRIISRQEDFNQAISEDFAKIEKTVVDCLKQANVQKQDINLLILTGGSTEIPVIKTQLRCLFPQAEISEENKLASVGYGLACDAVKKF